MTSRTNFTLIGILSLGALGCESQITDTENRTFNFECKNKTCTLSLQSKKTNSKQEKKADTTFTTNTEGRILTVCPSKNARFQCRPLKCETSSVCTQLGGGAFSCKKKFCQATERPLNHSDKIALCLAETGEWTRSGKQIERFTQASACTPPCEVPGACLSP